MPNSLDYARAKLPPARGAAHARTPATAAGVVALLVAAWWRIHFSLLPVGVVDTHFTRRPQDFPEFALTPWRPTNGAGTSLTREAIRPLTFWTLRYVQVTNDGGTTVETVAYDADVRWRPTAPVLIASALLPVIAYYVLRRLLFSPIRSS